MFDDDARTRAASEKIAAGLRNEARMYEVEMDAARAAGDHERAHELNVARMSVKAKAAEIERELRGIHG